MQRWTLTSTNIQVSALGFGCVQLTSLSKKNAVAMLQHAFAEGITHFDTARLYGFGRSEGILAECLQGKRDQVTITTKFGFEFSLGAKNHRLITLTKKLLKPFPRLLRRAKKHASTMVKHGLFSKEAALTSLETSLRELKTDYIDFFLLHEATMVDAANESLISTLEEQVHKGKIRYFGIASDFAKYGHDIIMPSSYRILQFNDDILQNNRQKLAGMTNQGIITHSVFKPAMLLYQAVTHDPNITKIFSHALNLDLTNPQILSKLILQYAVLKNKNGIVLFSSMNHDHITMNARTCEHDQLREDQSLLLSQLINQHLPAFNSATSP